MKTRQTDLFSTDCRRCGRLAHFLDGVRKEFPDYFARPVPPFGDTEARLLIVGLAPGMHGANRSGRPLTGDYAGLLLYRTLHKFGFANRAQSVHVDDGLIAAARSNAVNASRRKTSRLDEVKRCNAICRRAGGAAGAAVLALAASLTRQC